MMTAQLDLFTESFESAKTRDVYSSTLSKFLADTELGDLRKVDPNLIQNKLIEYVIRLKKCRSELQPPKFVYLFS